METLNDTTKQYERIIQEYLHVDNPILLKTGVLGTMANIFANLKYDANLYYSKLIKEINPATAEDFSSLLFHSNILDYNIEFATPATFDISFIVPDITVQDNQLITYTIKKIYPLVDIYNNTFTLDNDIEIFIIGSGVYGRTYTQTGIKNLKVDKVVNPNNLATFVYLVTLDEIKQYKRDFYSYVIPEYAVGESPLYTINVNKNNIMEINVWYRPGEDQTTSTLINYNLTELELYNFDSSELSSKFGINPLNIKYTKHKSNSNDLDIFLNIKDDKLEFNLGDGYNGQKRELGETLFIEIKTTNGEKANIQTTEWVVNKIQVQTENNIRTSQNNVTLKAVSMNGGTNGTTFYSNTEIRNNLLKKSRNRGAIISQKDFEDFFDKEYGSPFVDTKYFNSKSNLFGYNILRDFNNKIIPTNTFNVPEIEFDQQLFYPTKTYGDIELISPFLYKKRNNFYDAYIVNPEVKIDLLSKTDNKLIKLSNNIECYLTYDFILSKSKIELRNYNPSYTYVFSCNLFKMTLNKDNNFIQEISTLFTDEYCLVNEELTYINGYIKGLTNIKIEILNTMVLDTEIPENKNSTEWFNLYLMNWYSNDNYFQIEKKQSNYFYIEPDSYNPNKENKYVICVPYIEKNFFMTNDKYKVFSKLNKFFNIEENRDSFPFNVTVHQALYNTIQIPEIYKKYIISLNNNYGSIEPKLSLFISIIIDKTKFTLSEYKTIEEIEDNIKLLLISEFSKIEGFQLQYFESYIENLIIKNFNMVKNIEINNPKTLTINQSSKIYYKMEDDLGNTKNDGTLLIELKDIIDFVPPFFHFDFDNILIDFIID